MSEVEKMYENAGIKKDWTAIGFGDIEDCYPPFTAKKQLELIKWLAIHKSSYGFQYFGKQWSNCCEFEWENFEECSEDADFEQSLSGLINIIWQDLTEEEKQQIKEILE